MHPFVEYILGVTPGWRRLQADVQQILENQMASQETLNRIAASVDTLTTNIGNLGTAIGGVAEAVRSHPAAQGDDGQLAALADKLDTLAASVQTEATQLQAVSNTVSGAAASATATADPTTGSTAPATGDQTGAPTAQPTS